MAACQRLLTALMSDKSATSSEQAARVERIIVALEKHSGEELVAAAELLEQTSEAKDRQAALVACKVEAEKQPKKEAQPSFESLDLDSVEDEAAAKLK